MVIDWLYISIITKEVDLRFTTKSIKIDEFDIEVVIIDEVDSEVIRAAQIDNRFN